MVSQNLKSRLIAAAVIFFCIAFAWYASGLIYSHSLTNVDQISYDDGFLGGIDTLEQSYVVFQVDLRTGEDHYLEVPKIINKESCTLSQLTVMESGEIWLIREYTLEKQSHLDLVRCNFDTDELETVVHLEDLPGKLFYVLSSIEGRPHVFLYTEDGQKIERYQVVNQELVYVDTPIARNNENSQIFAPAEDGSVYEIYMDGWIYRQNEQGIAEPITKIGGSKEVGWNYNYQFYRDSILYENSKTGEWMEMDLTQKPYTARPCPPRCSPAKSFDALKMSGEYYDNGQVKCGKLFLEDGRCVPAVCGTYDAVIEQLSQDDMLIFGRVVIAVFYSSVFLLLRAVWRFLKKRHVVIPLVAYAAALTLLLMAMGIGFIRVLVSLILQENMEENIYGTCIQLGYESMEGYSLENIQTMCAYSEITPLNRLPYSYDRSSYQDMAFYDTDSENALSSDVGVTFRIYFRKDGEIYPLQNYIYIVNTPIAYNMTFYDFGAVDAMQRAFQEQKVVTLSYEDLLGREYSAFIPFNNAGKYPLLLEVAMSQAEGNRRITQQQIAMERILTLIAAMLTGAILLVVWVSMKPLRSLKEAALKITRGQLEARAYDRGRSEAAVTAVYFNRMAEQIAAQVSGSSAYQKKYEAFAPLWLLDALDRQSTMMAVKLKEKKEQAAFLLGEIHRQGGEALYVEDEETWCLFPKAAENALQAAMGIVKPFREETEVPVSIALDYGEVRLGIVGNSSRSSLETFTEGRGRTSFLRKCAWKYGTPVLITQSAADQIPEIERRFHLRLLGRFWFAASGKAEKIYEVLDGECAEMYRKKRLTEDAFQRGRKCFEEGDCLAARTAFVRVLTENQQDRAALHYIRLCDRALAGEAYRQQRTGSRAGVETHRQQWTENRAEAEAESYRQKRKGTGRQAGVRAESPGQRFMEIF